MSNYLRKLIVFTIIPTLYFVLMGLVNFSFYSNSNPDLGGVGTLIMGDSHPQKAVDPSVLSNARNISQPAEPYVLSFWKLKKILKSNHPDIVVLGFAPHNFSKFNDGKFSDEKWAEEMFSRSYAIADFGSLTEEISIDYKAYVKSWWRKNCFYPRKRHIEYIGEYRNSNMSDLSDLSETINRHYFYEGELLGFSSIASNYLDSIIKLCNTNNTDLLLVNTPVHHSYRNSIPDAHLMHFTKIVEEMKERNIKVMDFSNEVYPDSLYLNCNHLNTPGAIRFSMMLQNRLRSRS